MIQRPEGIDLRMPEVRQNLGAEIIGIIFEELYT